MNDQPDSKTGPVNPRQAPDAAGPLSPTDPAAAATDGSVIPPKLTPEEQMAAFEKALKEEDWGHQPC